MGSTYRGGCPPARRAGLTLLETAVLVSVVGVVLAALVPTFLRQVRVSKISEASDSLAQLHRRTAAYYTRHHKLPSGRRERRCLPPSAGPAPAEPSQQPVEIDFGSEPTPGHPTWSALGFQPDRPVRYRYSLSTEQAGCGPRPEGAPVEVRWIAEGDLDGDGVLSRFELRAVDADGSGELAPAGRLRTERRVE